MLLPWIAIGKQKVHCADVEYVTLNPPSGTCGDYLARFLADKGGYVTNPDATSACQVCPVSTTDQFMSSNFHIYYAHHWRNAGLLLAYVMFNVRVLSIPLRLVVLMEWDAGCRHVLVHVLVPHTYGESVQEAFP
jgi:ABC-type multidrug transport system permease subunit